MSTTTIHHHTEQEIRQMIQDARKAAGYPANAAGFDWCDIRHLQTCEDAESAIADMIAEGY